MLFARTLSTGFLALLLLSLPAAAYETVQVTGRRHHQGKLTYQGEIATKKIVVTKDNEVCGAIREEPLIVVGPDKGCRTRSSTSRTFQKGKAPQPAAKKPEISNHKCQFEPHVQAVRWDRSSSSTPTPSCTTRTASSASRPSSTKRCRRRG